jgi:hypothetical protein
MSSPLWMSIEPRGQETRLMLSEPSERCVLRARLSSQPIHRRSLITLMEACALWYGRPLHAVVDADAEDVRRDPEKWAALLGDAPELAVHVEWVSVPRAPRSSGDRFLGRLGDYRNAARLVTFAATGLR